MYDRWSLREICIQLVSSSISTLRFAEQGPRSLPIRKPCSLLKSGSQLSQKSERLYHPTGRASALCRTFEMTYVITTNNLTRILESLTTLLIFFFLDPNSLNIHHEAIIYVSVRNSLVSLPLTYQHLTFPSLFSLAMIIITLVYNVLYSRECV